jgi:hypothetical protein
MNNVIEWVRKYGELYKPVTDQNKYEPLRRDGGKYGWYVELVPPPPPLEILLFPGITDSEVIAKQLTRCFRFNNK